jgi:hypothetical protein
VEKGTHEKITGIQDEYGILSFFLFLLDNGGDPGPTPPSVIPPDPVGSIIDIRGKSQEVRMEVIGMNDGYNLFPGRKMGGPKEGRHKKANSQGSPCLLAF